jgi:hypothetical protein
MRNQKGFSAVEGLLIVIILGLLGFVGWYVHSAQSTTSKTLDNAAASSASPATTTGLKEYKNNQYGFSFSYPANWTIKEVFEDIGRGGKEGDVSVTSPNQTTVTFRADFGGKGGSCQENPADKPHQTENCNTLEILDIEQIAGKGIGNYPLNLYKTRFTAGGENKSEYGLFVDSGQYAATKKGPIIGAVFNIGLMNNDKGNITSVATGGDRTSPTYFDSVNAKEAISVLKTFRLF